MGARIFHVTFETVTPESAEQGDFAECGFMTPYGREDLEGKFGPEAGKVKAECALTLAEAVEIFGDRFSKGYLGQYSASGSLDWPEFTTVSYRTGEEIRYSLHGPDGYDLAPLKRYLER
jgi:hypothetical protein